jgi:diacylglycerol kinase (ATP)
VKITILINPSAGGGKARRVLDEAAEVLRHGGVEPRVRESRSSEHLVQLAREAREEQPDILVSAGGDGTTHYVLNGLFPSKVTLGIIPVGRGNDLARGLGIPSHPRKAAEVLLQGKVREIDLARVRRVKDAAPSGEGVSSVYACIAGVGFDSVVNRYANDRAHRLHGRFAYAWGILRCLKSYRPQFLSLNSDERTFHDEVIFAVIGNNTSYGDGVRIAPRARLDDGLLDVCIVPAMSKWELVRWIPRTYRGKHLAHPRIVYFQARSVTLNSPARLELFGDGEFLQELPAIVEVVPRALRVVVPS